MTNNQKAAYQIKNKHRPTSSSWLDRSKSKGEQRSILCDEEKRRSSYQSFVMMKTETDHGVCAACGITSNDDGIKLKTCSGCKLVKYCGTKCQREHRPKHKLACKKRAAELRDELLLKKPESTHLGDCPICFIPLPLDRESKCMLMSCCSKLICKACCTNRNREMDDGVQHKCPFCRNPEPKHQAEADQNNEKNSEERSRCDL